jgi:hypothetical protein
MPLANASVTLDGNSVSTDAAGQAVFTGLADDTYNYSVSATCYDPGSGMVTVAGANASAALALSAMSTNNLFFYIGDPLAIVGSSVNVTNGTDYDTTFVTWDTFGGQMLGDVPFGAITYTIITPCYETVTGTVTVDCNNGDGILVSANPAPIVIDPTVTLAGNTLTATATGVDYQWVDCNNGNAPIDGATGQSFEATESGSYAVTLTSGNCSQTSACTSVTVTGVNEINGRDAFAAYPVPFGDQLTLRNNGHVGPVRVQLFNLAGEVVLDETRSGVEIILQTAGLPSGSYVLQLTSGDARTTMRVVK